MNVFVSTNVRFPEDDYVNNFPYLYKKISATVVAHPRPFIKGIDTIGMASGKILFTESG
jgi:hypothetical protein